MLLTSNMVKLNMIPAPTPAKPVAAAPLAIPAQFGSYRLLAIVIFGLLASAVFDTELRQIVMTTIADAYLQVSAFVAGTLLLFLSIERLLKIDISAWMQRAGHLQVPTAALLGALPGCGGAIIVVTRYVSGNLSFGAVLATLTATMGDAAFLLLAKEPQTCVLIMVLGFSVGTLTGWIVDRIHGHDFLRADAAPAGELRSADIVNQDFSSQLLDKLWMIILIPGIVIGTMQAVQYDVDELLANSLIGRVLEQPATTLGFLGGSLCLVMWLSPRLVPTLMRSRSIRADNVSNILSSGSVIRRTIADTNFVTSWVVLAFLLFEVGIYLTSFDLKGLFDDLAIFTPLVAILIGFLPGCGPQILVTSLYLSGIVPISALIGNAISNDGDALFPAIAIAPRAAVVATIYSAIPALLLAYSWHFLPNQIAGFLAG